MAFFLSAASGVAFILFLVTGFDFIFFVAALALGWSSLAATGIEAAENVKKIAKDKE